MVRRVRRTAIQVDGHVEARRLSATLGREARAARRRLGRTLDQVASRIGIGRSRLSELERGDGDTAPIATWVALGIALGRPLAVSFSRALDESRSPTDAGHLAIQEHILKLARATGRLGTFELPTRPTDPTRSTDVGLHDRQHGTRINVECWPDDRIATVWVVRASAANRAILARIPHILDAAFPGSSRRWVRALTLGTEPPATPGIVWFDPAIGRLTDRRRATIPA